MTYNVYCDESCYLEHDNVNDMVIGAVWCPADKLKEINNRIRDIKKRNNFSESAELKWTKISMSKIDLYKDIVNYFFDDNNIHFRAIIIPDKSKLNHEAFNQTHDDWYYKMYFDMLKVVFLPFDSYNVYVDIKDTHSAQKLRKLHEVCCNSMYDFSMQIISKLQPIRSDEVQIMQIVDILIGAVCYQNRFFPEDFEKNAGKLQIIDLIKKRSNYSLTKTTLLREDKMNLFVWDARDTL